MVNSSLCSNFDSLISSCSIKQLNNRCFEVDRDDPNATITLKRLEAILKTCRDSGTLNQRFVSTCGITLDMLLFVY